MHVYADAGDLDPHISPHNLVTLKSAYIRLRALVDQGVIFVGHGLKKDFQMVNLVVPPHQVCVVCVLVGVQVCVSGGAS